MTCRHLIDDFLMRYVEGDLTLSERIWLGLHLLRCTNCRRYLEGYRRTMELEKATGLESESNPPEIPERLVKAILASRSTDKR